MQRIILVLIFVILLSGCKSKEEKEKEFEQKMYEQYQSFLSEASSSIEKIDTIFLGFKFGMTEKEFTNHIHQLVKEKKVYIQNNRYMYDFETKHATLKTTFSPRYFDGKLYELILKFNNSTNIAYDHAISMSREAIDVFDIKSQEEGFEKKTYKNEILDSYFIYYKKDNLLVEISYLIDAKMTYTNAPIKKKKEELEESAENIKSSKTYNDL